MKPSPVSGKSLLPAVILILLCIRCSLFAESTRTHYCYYKKPVPISYDTSTLLISVESGGKKDMITNRLAGLGIAPENLQSMPGKKRYSLKVPERFRERPAYDSLIDALCLEKNIQLVSPIFSSGDDGWIAMSPVIFVGFQMYVENETAEEIIDSMNIGTITDRDWSNMRGVFRIRCYSKNGLQVLETANKLAEMNEVRFAESDLIFTGVSSMIPNDPGFTNGSLWGLHNTGQSGGTSDADMDAPEAWDITIGDPSVKVLIIDVGVQQDHPDINQDPGIDVTSDGPGNGGPLNQYDNHGTPVAGCVSSIINNNLGTIGIAPGCKCVSARTFIGINSSGGWTSEASWTVASLDWAEKNGIRITNNSNYYDSASSVISEKYNQTRSNGMIHFGITGNNSSSSIIWPGTLVSVNAVGAIDRTGNHASWSNYGTGISFTAPGQDIYMPDRTGSAGRDPGDYTTWWGTSFATPYTAGVAALILSHNTALDADQLERIMMDSCVDLGSPGYDTMYGYGLVNAHQALLRATPHEKAAFPDPPDGATDISTIVTMSWAPGTGALFHNVYFGEDFDSVENADPTSPSFQLQTSKEIFEPGKIAGGKVFYWRVDEVKDKAITVKGDVWSFTTKTQPKCVSFWNLDGDARDHIGENHGELHGPIGGMNRCDSSNSAMAFDGVDDYILVPNYSFPNPNKPDFTLAFWFKISDISGSYYQYMISQNGYLENNSMNVYFIDNGAGVAPGQLRTIFVLEDGTTWYNHDTQDVNIPAGLSNGEWHWYTLTISPTEGIGVYIDGDLKTKDISLKGTGYHPGAGLYFGGRSDLDSNRFFGSASNNDGLLDDIRIYDQALSPEEIRWHFQHDRCVVPGVHWSLY